MAEDSVRFLKETEFDIWNRLVENHPSGTAFQTSVFLYFITTVIAAYVTTIANTIIILASRHPTSQNSFSFSTVDHHYYL